MRIFAATKSRRERDRFDSAPHLLAMVGHLSKCNQKIYIVWDFSLARDVAA